MGLGEHLAWAVAAAFIVLGSGALAVFGAVAAVYGAVHRCRAKRR